MLIYRLTILYVFYFFVKASFLQKRPDGKSLKGKKIKYRTAENKKPCSFPQGFSYQRTVKRSSERPDKNIL
jgi:hypothetical protein